MAETGTLCIFDAGCYKHLTDGEFRRNFQARLHASGYIAGPSAMNAIELASSPAPTARQARLVALADIAGTNALLPFPTDILRQCAEAHSRGDSGFHISPSGAEWVLDELPGPDHPRVRAGKAHLDDLDAAFQTLQQDYRDTLPPGLRASPSVDPIVATRTFLDREGDFIRNLGQLLPRLTTAFAVEAPTDPSLLADTEPWRLLLESFAVAFFETAVLPNQPRPVHLSDLLQLQYLAGVTHRVFVAEDKALVRAASAILHERYASATVYSWDAFHNSVMSAA